MSAVKIRGVSLVDVAPVGGGHAGEGLEDAVERGFAGKTGGCPHFGQLDIGVLAEQLLRECHTIGVHELWEGAALLRLDTIRKDNASRAQG